MKVALVFIYNNVNKYSIHTLIAASESRSLGLDKYLVGIDEFNELFKYVINRYSEVIIALSLMTTQLPRLLNFINYLKGLRSRYGSKVLLVGGGPHVSGDPLGSLKSLGFDYVFIGEAENSFTEFLHRLIYGGDVKSVKGMAYLEDDEYVFTGKAEPVDLDLFPPISVESRLFNPIEISRGCPYACKYCQVSYIFGGLMRHRSVESIIKYCRLLINYGVKDLRFISPNSLAYGGDGRSLNFSALSELLGELKKLRNLGGRTYLGTFPSEVRPDFIDREVIKLLKESVSNKRVAIGAQSGSERVLRDLGRGHGVDEVLNAVKLLREYGFNVDVDLIFGLPIEGLDDMMASVELIRRLLSIEGVKVRIHSYIPLPGTPLFKLGVRELPESIKRELLKYLGKGMIFGDWLKQEELAREIIKLKDLGVIIGVNDINLRSSNTATLAQHFKL